MKTGDRIRIKAADLDPRDRVLVTVMGGEEMLHVLKVRRTLRGRIRARLDWGGHIPNAEPFWETFEPDRELHVIGGKPRPSKPYPLDPPGMGEPSAFRSPKLEGDN